MKEQRTAGLTKGQIAEMWDRWQRGETVNSFGRAFDREHSSTAGQFEHAAGKFGENYILVAGGKVC